MKLVDDPKMKNKDTQNSRARWLIRWELWQRLHKHFLDLIKEEAEEEVEICSGCHGEYQEGEDEEHNSGVDGDTSDDGGGDVGRKRKRAGGGKNRTEDGRRVKDRGEGWKEVEMANVDLPSRWGFVLSQTDAVKRCREVEQGLRQRQAGEALDDLRDCLITTYALHQQVDNISGVDKRAQARD